MKLIKLHPVHFCEPYFLMFLGIQADYCNSYFLLKDLHLFKTVTSQRLQFPWCTSLFIYRFKGQDTTQFIHGLLQCNQITIIFSWCHKLVVQAA